MSETAVPTCSENKRQHLLLGHILSKEIACRLAALLKKLLYHKHFFKKLPKISKQLLLWKTPLENCLYSNCA